MAYIYTCPKCGHARTDVTLYEAAYINCISCRNASARSDWKIHETKSARDPLLTERESTHGSFKDNAAISQQLKDLLHSSPNWQNLTYIERESMDMICLKFSRILSGKSMKKQHWEDVRGYASLVEKACTNDTP